MLGPFLFSRVSGSHRGGFSSTVRILCSLHVYYIEISCLIENNFSADILCIAWSTPKLANISSAVMFVHFLTATFFPKKRDMIELLVLVVFAAEVPFSYPLMKFTD